MSTLIKIDNDLKDAMRAKDAAKLGVLRMLKAAIKNAAIEKGNRPELAAAERAEIETLNAYLPQALSAEAIETLVREAIAETGATSRKEMGAVMKLVNAKAAGRADGRALSTEVQKQLA